MLSGQLFEGGTASQVSGLNKKNRRFGLFKLHSSFYTSRGGDRRPQSAEWGLLLKLHGTSLEKSNFNPRVYFTVTFAWFVRAVAHKTILEAGLKNSTIQ